MSGTPPTIWLFFFVSGAAIGTWSADIPAVRDRLDLSTATMSGLILLIGLSSVGFGLVSGQLLLRWPSARLVRIGAFLTPVTAALVLVAPSLPALVIALVAFGTTYALLDVSMNAHGVAIETRFGTAIMSSLHGGWSIGGLVGAGAVAVGHLLGVDYRVEAAVFFSTLALLGLVCGRCLLVRDEDRVRRTAATRRGLILPVGSVVMIGFLALLLFAVEGVVLDWGSSYVVRDTTGNAALGATAVAAFSAGMAVGRVLGDAGNRRVGPPALLQAGAATVSAALLVMVVAGGAGVTVPALFLTGVGAANSAPLLLSAAGRSGAMPSGAAIAATTMIGNIGLLFVSPALGFVAQFSSFSVTMICAGVIAAVACAGSRRIRGSLAGPAL